MPLTLSGTTGIAGVDGSAGTPALKGGTSSTAGIAYPAADTVSIATASTERVRVDSSGNLLVGVTSANANGGVLQLKSGITFPATQSQSSDVNTLDDYEEGTWTPNVGGTATYGARTATYTKIGDTVRCYFDITISTLGTGSGQTLSGFPFAAAYNDAGCVSYWSTLAVNVLSLSIQMSSSGCTFVGQTTASGTIVNGFSLFGNGCRVIGTVVYRV